MSIYVNSLLAHINNVKPYHTKILGVEISYVYEEYSHVTMTEEFHIHTNVGLLFDKVEWNYSSIMDGQLPDNQLVDGIYATLHEEFSVDMKFVELPIESQYTFGVNMWDTPLDGFPIISVTSNAFVVKGNVGYIFNAIPNTTFNVIYSSNYSGIYTCTNAYYDNVTDTTIVIVLETGLTPSDSSVNLHGFVEIGLWDAVGWDGDTEPVPVGIGSFSVDGLFGETLSIEEGLGWDHEDLGGWDATDGTYSGTEPEHLHLSDYWTNPVEWDQGVCLISGSSDRSIEGYGSPDTKVVFAYNDVPNPHQMKKIHDQLINSMVWVVNVEDYFNPQIIAFNTSNEQIEWVNLERPDDRTIIITFANQYTGYVLGI